ncbi:hypothetical protein A1Q1_06945 [Trichosporon asahii var. asahii CBS 2479]|uniref:Vacuolar sorting protein Vps3844 C-terminal domain-containing protein n=1 Tax=Trichosporon asahii var. asahii (strain ATCC 90039 / CBS 2479 / JCM 2466 / KCTC 7840 / NBRC 103889/ NCYC 2677 / UAMH 7654) TaxID=1186058 RepID=J6F934_TRIAS|nr:hypothetical protein A1Q1_06945 [Trichosporon asahii var. asahii CBS 2479]EJT51807.1 hypothetical protein A1Q1_06945 [Trichosporon asahii var. asahii CBS 2479]
MRLSLLLLAPLALAQQAQVYLYPPPSDSSSSPSLTADQAEVVIAHHLGDGIESRPTPQDEGLWGHLLNVWQHEKRPRVVIVEVVLPDDAKPAFTMETSTASSVLAPYVDAAREALAKVGDIPEVSKVLTSLDFAVSRAGSILSHELASLVALADSMWAATERNWDAVRVHLDVEKGSELWETATSGVRAGVKAMTMDDASPLVLVVMPKESSQDIETSPWKRDTLAELLKKKEKVVPKDYSVHFSLFFGTIILLAVAAIGGIQLLASVGETELPSTLTLAVSRKHD